MFKIGWFSTGRDQAARDLLKTAWQAIKRGKIPDSEIAFVFCDRKYGESPETDKFLDLVKKLGITSLPSLSSASADIYFLAGYMRIISAEMCQSYPIINLHPAKPGGPKGSWQEVIQQLIANREKASGVMIHLVTPELDAGPPLTYCVFPIEIPYKTDDLWKLWDFFHEDWVKDKLFKWIREEGLKREFPLIVETLKLLAAGEIQIKNPPPGGYDLTKIINKKLKSVA